MKPKIVIVDSQNNRYVDNSLSVETAVLNGEASLVLKKVNHYQELLNDESFANADVIISWYAVPIPAALIQKLNHCKAIVRPAVGFDNIDIKAARIKNIPVINIPDYGTEEVADHTLALILACTRNILNTNFYAKKGEWDWKKIGPDILRLRNSKAGIVGLGRIGKSVALRLKTFGVSVYFYDPYEKSGIHKALGICECDSLEELLRISDIITFHVPLTAETKGLLNKKNIHLIKDNAILVNTSRGEVIAQPAIIDLLNNNKKIKLGLDVLANEPHVPETFKNDDRVILTSHSAFYSDDSLLELKQKAIHTAINVIKNKYQKNIVNSFPSTM